MIVFLSTFPPRRCGIATFTADLTRAIDQMFGSSVATKIVALNPTEISRLPYPGKVIFQICQTHKEDYVAAAEYLNRLKKVKLINIQHEYGIFGGQDGEYLLEFLKSLQKPVVITFHTVLPEPNPQLLRLTQALAHYSQGITVMTRSSQKILEQDYGVRSEQIQVIPHGIHHVPYTASSTAKSLLGLSHRLVLSTFGLIGPGKGIEAVIDALPPVVKKFPQVRFLIAGITHPVILEQTGETYRNSLIKKVYDLGLTKSVLFYNVYFSLKKLLQFLAATDIYLASSLNPKQTVSGTLSYALGSGRPVISTAFAQAKEDITSQVGLLVDFNQPKAFTAAILKLLGNDRLRQQMAKNAYFRTRHMTWSNVALSYMKYFSRFNPELSLAPKKLPPIKLAYLTKLTDAFGIIQFAKLTEPDLSSGYTLDDNARALLVAALHYQQFKSPASLKLCLIYLNFIRHVSRPDGRFDNYVNSRHVVDNEKNQQESFEDPTARGLYSLARIATLPSLPLSLRRQAESLFNHSFLTKPAFSFPRSIAFYIKALYYLPAAPLQPYCNQLLALYEKHHSPDWDWFEPSLTYSNAVLPEALLLGYQLTRDPKYLEAAKKTLDFLISQTFKDNLYIPIGQSGWFPKGGTRQYFDQQPEDTTATIETLNTMFQVTHQKQYQDLAYQAFNWFLGENVLNQVVYDRTTGGCYDGIGEKSINLNQGAESTISYLLARLSFSEK